jgi:CRISPR type III-B/RAMP module-associated protein Cmr3
MTEAAPGRAPTRWLAFVPRDTVIVRDGRSFNAGSQDGSGSRAESVTPWPSTIAGAVTTALNPPTAGAGAGAVVEPAAVRGPVLAKRAGEGWATFFRAPADLAVIPGERAGDVQSVTRLRPGAVHCVTGGRGVRVSCDLADGPQEFMLPPDGIEGVDPLAGLLPASAMVRYLADGVDDHPTSTSLDLLPEDPFVPETRVGLARVGRTAREGFLYSMTHLRPRDGWGLLAQCQDDAASCERTPSGPVPLGGKARLADVEIVADLDWPTPPDSYPGGRVLLYVVTPALWEGGWRPPLPDGVALVGACVPGSVPVATASPRLARSRGRRLVETVLLRWAVPPGAVYLVQFPGSPETAESEAARWARSVHGRALGPGLDPGTRADGAEADGAAMGGPAVEGEAEDRTSTAGFGVVLTGRWAGHQNAVAAASAETRS